MQLRPLHPTLDRQQIPEDYDIIPVIMLKMVLVEKLLHQIMILFCKSTFLLREG
jgi:hypothetical protein